MINLEKCYQILNLKPTASLLEIKQAYRQQARLWHPDRFINEPEKQALAEAKFKEINEAYEILRENYTLLPQKSVYTETDLPEIKINKAMPEYYYNLGLVTAKKGNYEESLTYLARAIKLNPDYLEALKYRKKILEQLGFHYRAKADARKILEIELNRRKTTENYRKYPHFQEGTMLIKEHSGAVTVIVNYQDQYFVSGSADKNIKIWDLQNFRLLNTLKGHSGKINSLDLNPNGKIIISGSTDKTIKIWERQTGNLLITLGGFFAGHSASVLVVKFTKNYQYILSGSEDETIKLWDLKSKKPVYTIVDLLHPITHLIVSPNGQNFAHIGLDQYVTIRNINQGDIIKSIKVDAQILTIAYHPQKDIIAVGCHNGMIYLFNLEIKQKMAELRGSLYSISHVLFTKDGQYLFTISVDHIVSKWDWIKGKKIDYIQPKVKKILGFDVSLDRQLLLMGDLNKTIQIYHYN